MSATAETVISDVSFAAESGELVALVGPTGAGKSTSATWGSRSYARRSATSARTRSGRAEFSTAKAD